MQVTKQEKKKRKKTCCTAEEEVEEQRVGSGRGRRTNKNRFDLQSVRRSQKMNTVSWSGAKVLTLH